jgi:hypothetical protein
VDVERLMDAEFAKDWRTWSDERARLLLGVGPRLDAFLAVREALASPVSGDGSRPASPSVPTEREVRLVLAARAVAFGDHFSPSAIKELDAASEAYAADVPWEDEPQANDPCGGCGESNPANRCIGCMHVFSPPSAASRPPGMETLQASECTKEGDQ